MSTSKSAESILRKNGMLVSISECSTPIPSTCQVGGVWDRNYSGQLGEKNFREDAKRCERNAMGRVRIEAHEGPDIGRQATDGRRQTTDDRRQSSSQHKKG
ncbi:hypothetical protein J3458_001115 [Metarhizium acridum]|uniref:uncharacterized protein n=1 Tax=Metarhizium acridum TaxID=92637 RepID=UPI001C6C21B3|nr:hypothetical protein J3458_001115 [Metarhizium acridum]